MKLDIRGLEISGPNEEKALPFDCELDLSALTWWGEHPYPDPVRAAGKVVNRGDFYETSYTVRCVRAFSCARCLKAVEQPETLPFAHIVIETDEDPFEADGFLPLNGGVLDLERMVADDLLLGLGEPGLCSPECPGLCPACGGKRGECDCVTDLPDPRFDAIRRLLQDEPEE